MESVFDVILTRFESKYLSVHAALDTKLLIENPTTTDARWLKLNVPNNQAALGYFFDQLQNPKWLEPMESEGLFKRPPDPIYEPEKNSTYFPAWPQSRYLVRMAALDSSNVKTKVAEVLLGLDSSNFMIHLDIIDAACRLPIDLATRVARKETLWLRDEEWIGHLVPDKLADLTVYLADGNKSDEAIAIASSALGFVPTESSEAKEDENYFRPGPRTRIESWDWGRFINKCWRSLADTDWQKTLDLFCSLLDEYLKRKNPERIESGESFSYIWRRAIENDEDDVPNRLLSTRRQNNAFPLGWFLVAVIAIFAQFASAHGQKVSRVESVGFTVSDMDTALNFYTRMLPFEKVSNVETMGTEIEHLSGVFGARVRVVRLKLGDETLELTEYLTPQGRPIPVDSRSNDRWFQHVAIIVSDMDKAYEHLRANKVRHASTAPQTLPSYIIAAAGIRAFYFKDFDNHVLEILSFPPDKVAPRWHELFEEWKAFSWY